MVKRILSYIALFGICAVSAAQTAADSGLFLDAAEAYAAGDYALAKSKFATLLEACPEDDAVSYYLGMSEYALGNYSAAAENISAAAQLDSANAWYLHSLVSVYSSQQDSYRAGKTCEKLLKMKPGLYNTPYTQTLIGDSYLMERRDSAAVAHYTQALEMDPGYVPAVFGRMEAYRTAGNYPDFFVDLGRLISDREVRSSVKGDYLDDIVKKMDSRFYWVYGTLLEEKIDTCLAIHPDDLKVRELKIAMISIRQDWDSLIAESEKLVELARAQGNDEKLALAYYYIGDVNYQLGNEKKAFKAYERALKAKPDYPVVLNNYAYYLSLKKKSLRKALAMSQKAVELEPDNATYLDTCGWILYLLKRPAEAKPHFKRAMIFGGKDSAVVLEHYSKVLEALGENDLASYYHSLSVQKGGQ